MNSLGPSQTAAGVLTILLIVYVVGVLYGAVRHANFAGLLNAAVLLGVMYVGWTLRAWPHRHHKGMFLTLLIAWRDSVVILATYAAKLIGLTEFWHYLQGLVP